MHRTRQALAAVLLLCGGAGAAPAATNDLYEPVPLFAYPPAAELRADLLAALPDAPILVEARLRVRPAAGREEHELPAAARLDLGPGAARAVYVVARPDGTGTERLEVVREPGAPAQFERYTGDPPARMADPDLYAPILGSDLSWIDLSLSFLWWEGGETVDRERLRGRTCYIVDVPAPHEEPGAYGRVRMWIDPGASVLLKAEAFDREGNPVRTLLVESFKKVDDVWFIKDIDVYSLPSRRKTTLRVDSVEVENPPAPLLEGSRGD